MNYKKIIFIDIDGTLRDSKREIRKVTINALKKVINFNYGMVVCTGRALDYTLELNIPCDFIIYNNGGGIYDNHLQKVIYENYMVKESVIELCDLSKNNNVKYVISANCKRYASQFNYTEGEEIPIFENVNEFILNNNIISVTISSTEYIKIKSIYDEILKVSHTHIANQSRVLTDDSYPITPKIYCDVVDLNTSKGNGLKKLCELYNIDKKNTIAIGDDTNDLSMLLASGYGVAMGNALPILKENANYITSDNDNDGVAYFLNQLK